MSKIAFLFPGQGSQYLGMGKDFYERFDWVKDIWNKADEILGIKLEDIVFGNDEERLKDTSILQPAIFLVSFSIGKYLENEKGIVPDMVAGHSLGEYSALIYSEVVSFEDGVRLLSLRGKFMQEAANNNPGAMAAVIGMDYEEILKICKEVEDETKKYVAPANFNSPSQIVISGYNESVDLFIEKAKDKAKKIVKLNVSGAFHSPLMEEAKERLKEYVEKIEFSTPKYDFYQNVDGKLHSDVNEIKSNILEQITSCVMWTEEILNMKSNGLEKGFEVGPGKVLKGLIRQIDRTINVVVTDNLYNVEKIE